MKSSAHRQRRTGASRLTEGERATTTRRPTRRTRFMRLIDRRRRTVASALLCAAVAVAVYQLTPPSAALASVVVAASDLPAGSTVQAGHLRLAHFPAESLPDHAATALESVAGQRLAGPVRRGEVITDAAIVGPGLLAGAPSGTVAVPVRVADADSLELIRTGQAIDLVLSEDTTTGSKASTRLASGVTVLWTDTGRDATGPWAAPTAGSAGLVVVAADPDRAPVLAGASARGKVFFALVDKR